MFGTKFCLCTASLWIVNFKKLSAINELTVSSNLKGLTKKFNELFCKAPFSEVQNFWDNINLCLYINFKTL